MLTEDPITTPVIVVDLDTNTIVNLQTADITTINILASDPFLRGDSSGITDRILSDLYRHGCLGARRVFSTR